MSSYLVSADVSSSNLKSALDALTTPTPTTTTPQPTITTAPPSPDAGGRARTLDNIASKSFTALPSPKEIDRELTKVAPDTKSRNTPQPAPLPTPNSPSIPHPKSTDQTNNPTRWLSTASYAHSPSIATPVSATSSEIRFDDSKRKASWEPIKSGSSSPEIGYKCTECGQPFRRSHDMKRHMKSHSGERPYVCTICERPFARLDALHRHQRAEGGAACKAVHSQRIPTQPSPRPKMPRPPGSAKLSPLERSDLPSPAVVSPLPPAQSHGALHPDQRLHEDIKPTSNFRPQQHPSSAPQRQNSGGKPHIPTLIIPVRASQPYPNEAPYTPSPPLIGSNYSSRNGGENLLSASATYPMHSAGSSHNGQEHRGRESSLSSASDDEAVESASGPARPILPYPQNHHPITTFREQQLVERNHSLEERMREMEQKQVHDRKHKRRIETLEQRVHDLEVQNELLRSLIIEGKAYGNNKRRRVSYSDEEDELEKSSVASAAGFHQERERDAERR